MRVVIAGRTVELGKRHHRLNVSDRRTQTSRDVRKLFAQCGGCGGLTMGASKHWLLGLRVRNVLHARQHVLQLRHKHLIARTPKHQGMRGIVDIFRGAGKVNKLACSLELCKAGHLLF